MTQYDYCFITFDINEPIRFQKLIALFNKIKEIKHAYQLDKDAFDPLQKVNWQTYLDDKAIKWFESTFDFKSEEGKIYSKLWELTTPHVRLNHPFFIIPGNWDFESMLDAIINGEYSLVDIIQDEELENIGTLYFDPYSFPFGGTECLIELIESFGNNVTFDSTYGHSQVRLKSEWNFNTAKKLVQNNRGFSR